MIEDGLLLEDAESFDALIAHCMAIQEKANAPPPSLALIRKTSVVVAWLRLIEPSQIGPNTQSPLGAPIPPRNSWQGISADMDLHYVRFLYDQPSDSRNHFELGPSAASICPKRLRTLSGSPMLVAASRAYRYASLASRLVIS